MVALPKLFDLPSDDGLLHPLRYLLSACGNGCQNVKLGWATIPWACLRRRTPTSPFLTWYATLSFSLVALTGRPTDHQKKIALPARLYPNSPFASRYPLGVLRQARQTSRALALPTRIPAHARALAASGRVLPFSESDACITSG